LKTLKILTRVFIIAFLLLPFKGMSDAFPVMMINGLIITEATIEGRSVHVILDTGAPGLVLNKDYYLPDPEGSIPCTGINGDYLCQSKLVKEWSWLGTSSRKTKAILTDLSFLETKLGLKIYALIGLSVLSEYYVEIDVDLQQITLTKSIDPSLESSFSRIQFVHHLPVLACKVNGQKKILALDTGSAANYLFSYDAKDPSVIPEAISPVMVTGTGNIQDVKHFLNFNLEVPEGAAIRQQRFIVDLNDRKQFRHAEFDGILGQEFLGQYNLIIHPGKQKLLLIPNNHQDMVIGESSRI
jgi:hypothetical protein